MDQEALLKQLREDQQRFAQMSSAERTCLNREIRGATGVSPGTVFLSPRR